MDKKTKKKIDILNQKLQKLRLQLSGAKQQADEPDEVENLQSQIDTAEAELAKLRAG